MAGKKEWAEGAGRWQEKQGTIHITSQQAARIAETETDEAGTWQGKGSGQKEQEKPGYEWESGEGYGMAGKTVKKGKTPTCGGGVYIGKVEGFRAAGRHGAAKGCCKKRRKQREPVPDKGECTGAPKDKLAALLVAVWGCIFMALAAGIFHCRDVKAGYVGEEGNPQEGNSGEVVKPGKDKRENNNTKRKKVFGRQDRLPGQILKNGRRAMPHGPAILEQAGPAYAPETKQPKSDFFRQVSSNIWEKEYQSITAAEYAQLTSIQIDTLKKTVSFQLDHGVVQTMSYRDEARMDTADLAVFTGLEWISADTELHPGDLQGLEGLFGLYALNTAWELADIAPYPENITELGIADKGMGAGAVNGTREKNLDGIEYFPNLAYLSVEYETLGDISALLKFPGLQGLILEGCSSLADYSPLASLANLEWLKIASGSLENIDFASSMGRLVSLSIEGSKVKSLDVLEECAGLAHLNLTGNPMIEDYSVIGQLCGLEELTLEMGRGGKLPSFGQLVRLERLSLKGVDDLSPLKDAKSVISLFLDHCSGAHLEAVSGMTELDTLEVHGFSAAVESLDPLTGLSKLTSLLLQDITVSGNIEEIFGIPTLKILHLDECNVGINFARLPVNESLEILSMNGIRISSASREEGAQETRLSEHYELFGCFPNLTELYLESLGLEDIAFICRLPHLQHLDISDNPVTSLKELQCLEEIRTVWYGGGTLVFP